MYLVKNKVRLLIIFHGQHMENIYNKLAHGHTTYLDNMDSLCIVYYLFRQYGQFVHRILLI